MTATEAVGPGLLAAAESTAAEEAGPQRRRKRRALLPYLLVAPFLAYECLFVFYPIVKGVILAFQSTNFGKTKFVGFSNFAQMVHDPTFWASVQTTAEFTLSMVAIWLCFGLGVALLMNWTFPGPRSYGRPWPSLGRCPMCPRCSPSRSCWTRTSAC